MPFTIKRVHLSGSLGDDLRELRERAGLTVEQAARQTKVVPSTIRAWEQGSWSSFGPEVAYLERMLMGYVRAFGGRESFYLSKFHQELVALNVKPVKAQIQEMRPFHGLDLFLTARARVALFLCLFVSSLGFYVVAQARSLAAPPPLEIFSPQDGQRLDGPIVQVRGRTSPEATVYVNEQAATLREDGTFELNLEIPRGATELQVRVKKRHSKDVVGARRVVFERDSEPVQEL